MARHLFTGFSTRQVTPGSVKTTLYDLDLIKTDLMNQFMTRKGERVMLPNYGTRIWDQLFEPFTDAVKSIILQDVLDVVNAEPRVTLQNVNINESTYGLAIEVSLFYIPWSVVDTLSLKFDQENQSQN
jgi:phage baseplate assembly protein W